MQMQSPPLATARAVRIRAEQIRAQYANMPFSFVGSALVASLIVAMLYGRLGSGVLFAWLASVYLLSIARLALWSCFRSLDSRPDVWERLAILSAGLAGLVWGTGGILMHDPTSLAHQLFVLVACTGLAVTSTYLAATVFPAFVAYVCPIFVLSAVSFLLDGDRIHIVIGAGTVLLLPALIHFAARVSRSFLESVNARLQNAELVEELREQKQAAEEANIAKSRFLAAASHDLRQPLLALGLFVQALQDSTVAAHERHIVANVKRSVAAMEELFDALLDISRLDAGAVHPRVETFPLASVFERLAFEFAPVARQKALSLSVIGTSAFVRSDPTLLERIIRNLMSNAVRYTDRGGLVLGCRREAGAVRIVVCDSGTGIPAAKHREIFKEFAQLDCTDRDRRKGLGLGLAIVERLARLLGHEVRVRSVPGKGSAFSVTVPRGRAADFIGEPVVGHTAFDLSESLILVVDEEPAVCQAMEVMLGRWSCEVIAARSAAEMKEKLAGIRRIPSLIIADHRSRTPAVFANPPALGVVEMLRGEFNSDIPALLSMTGDAGGEHATRLQEITGLPVLCKPLNPARLRTLIAHVMRLDRPEPRRASRERRPESVSP